jgi:CRP-like cAMP-binding protein
VYVIRAGECEVVREGRTLVVLGAGDYFGEMAVTSERKRNATVLARRAMDVLLIPKEDFGRLRGERARRSRRYSRIWRCSAAQTSDKIACKCGSPTFY